MWFRQMHPGWQLALSAWEPWLASMENELAQISSLVPSSRSVMAAFESDPESARVVLVGQDPYPIAGVAIGHAFAVSDETEKLPASLRNIFKELENDLAGVGEEGSPSPTLMGWRSQGVLLLNRHLTTVVGEPGAHSLLGWDNFTLAAVQHLLGSPKPPVLILWGNHAHKLLWELKRADGAVAPIAVLSAHPSPLSAHRGFFGSRPFTKVNEALSAVGQEPIDWTR